MSMNLKLGVDQGLILYKKYINDDPGLNLSCLTARSNLFKIVLIPGQMSGERSENHTTGPLVYFEDLSLLCIS